MMARGRLWTAAEDEALLACEITPWTERHISGGGELAKLAKKLGRTFQACRNRLEKIRPGNLTHEGLWSAAEDEYIRQHIGFPKTPRGTWPAVAEELGRTYGAVLVRACYLRREMEAAS